MVADKTSPSYADEKAPPPDELAELPARVLTDNPAENQYYAQFVANGEEWRAEFEKKLMRKVDFRLIPLLVIMYINNFM